MDIWSESGPERLLTPQIIRDDHGMDVPTLVRITADASRDNREPLFFRA
jgi:hypothetical protein